MLCKLMSEKHSLSCLHSGLKWPLSGFELPPSKQRFASCSGAHSAPLYLAGIVLQGRLIHAEWITIDTHSKAP